MEIQIDQALQLMPEKLMREFTREVATGRGPISDAVLPLNTALLRRAEEIRQLKGQLDRALENVSKLEHNIQVLKNAVWKACGDDEDAVNATIESQGELRKV